MSSQSNLQYAFRAQKYLGLVGGSPDYEPLESFVAPDVPTRTFTYSSDGRLFAYAMSGYVRIFQAKDASLLQELVMANVHELSFSPRGTYLSTWERPVKREDGVQHLNLHVFSVSTGEVLAQFSQKSQETWDLQYTTSESHAVRLVGQEIQVYRPAEWDKGIETKVKVEGATSVALSPGLNPSIAVFFAEKKGAPASIKIYGLLVLSSPPSCQKSFYKADQCKIKWNTLGTQVLLLTSTEVDKSNKSYYGETGLYLLSAAGNFDCRVTLDKDGPIHDFAWSPNSKEFAVVYGYMPAKAMLFDQRVNSLHDFGSSPHNYVSFNPQGRLVALGGFGNLAGQITIVDRRSLVRIATISAPNTSHCSWSPDGRFLLTATLSPRLRVDNGIKIWHCSGSLLHVQLVEELYQAEWRPCLVENVPAFGNAIPLAPVPSASVGLVVEKPAGAKAAGAYRPPGARGLATPAIFKREDEGGIGTPPGSGANTPTKPYSRSHSMTGGQDGPVNGRRHVPGAPPPSQQDGTPKGSRRKKVQKEEREFRKNGDIDGNAPAPGTNGVEPLVEVNTLLPTSIEPSLKSPNDMALDPIAKKMRNLNKKLKAIDELKEKAKRGERLEATQLKKIEGEADIRKELDSLEGLAS